jgi:hypothetical protein
MCQRKKWKDKRRIRENWNPRVRRGSLDPQYQTDGIANVMFLS